MGDRRAVTIDALVVAGHLLLWCRVCGPLGVAQGKQVATEAVLAHLQWHGCDLSQITMKEHE